MLRIKVDKSSIRDLDRSIHQHRRGYFFTLRAWRSVRLRRWRVPILQGDEKRRSIKHDSFVEKWIWIWVITNDIWMWHCIETITSQRGRSINRWSIVSVVVITWERLSKVWVNSLHPAFSLSVIQNLVVPHITDAIQEWVERVARISVDEDSREPDVCIIEVKCPEKGGNHFSPFFCSWVERSVISRVCRSSKPFDNYNFEWRRKTSVWFMSVSSHKYVTKHFFLLVEQPWLTLRNV